MPQRSLGADFSGLAPPKPQRYRGHGFGGVPELVWRLAESTYNSGRGTITCSHTTQLPNSTTQAQAHACHRYSQFQPFPSWARLYGPILFILYLLPCNFAPRVSALLDETQQLLHRAEEIGAVPLQSEYKRQLDQ